MLKVVSPSRERVLEEELNFETLLARISSRFVNIPSGHVDGEIEDALRTICRSLELDESSIFLRAPNDPHAWTFKYVLRDPALPPPVPAGPEDFPWCYKHVIVNETVCLPDIEALPPEAAIDKATWKRLGVYSALVIPLSTGGNPPLGIWGIDSTSKPRDWPEPLQKRLKILADVFADALERAETERRLRESESRLRLAANTTGAGFWTIDVESGILWATGKLEELFGVNPEDAIDSASFLAIVHPDDREAVQQAIDSMIAGNEATVEYRIVPAGGSVRWVLSRGNRNDQPSGKPPMLMGITLDITERHGTEDALRSVSGRLLQAQEAERKRIARELHDGIGQHMAMIAMGIHGLREAGDLACTQITELYREINNVATAIQLLSHELHSSSLDYLGLAAAINGFANEFGRRHNVDIIFEHKDVPRSLPSDLAMALFRITQEALRNALKHSRVTQFAVRLEGKQSRLELRIYDAGAGFDVQQATQGHGLGLISMRERASVFQGRLTIQTQPGHGTEILVQVPITPA